MAESNQQTGRKIEVQTGKPIPENGKFYQVFAQYLPEIDTHHKMVLYLCQLDNPNTTQAQLRKARVGIDSFVDGLLFMVENGEGDEDFKRKIKRLKDELNQLYEVI